MSLKILVKVGGITNLSDARYCAGMGVEMLGFSLNPESPQYIDSGSYSDITNWLAGVKFVGELEGMNIENIKLATQNYKINYLETDDSELLEELSELGIPILFNLLIKNESEILSLGQKLNVVADYCEIVIIRIESLSLAKRVDAAIKELKSELTIIKGFGINNESIDSLLMEKAYNGIELKGSEEEFPGFKEYGELMDLLEYLEED